MLNFFNFNQSLFNSIPIFRKLFLHHIYIICKSFIVHNIYVKKYIDQEILIKEYITQTITIRG